MLAASLLLAILVALPAVFAAHRRRVNREISEVASSLIDFAAAQRRAPLRLSLDEQLLARARRLHIPELISFEFVRGLPAPDPALLADSAQRLALRLKRRVAFERKMLARTAAGRWRGSVVATAPAVILLAMSGAGLVLPMSALAALLALETLGCWLLLRAARVEV